MTKSKFEFSCPSIYVLVWRAPATLNTIKMYEGNGGQF